MESIEFMRNTARGFTLSELLITITILGILAAIAYPSYTRYIRNARLSDAQKDLIDNVRQLNRYYAQHATFKKNSTTWADLATTQNEFFCYKIHGNPRGAASDKFNIKAVAFDKTNEPRVLIVNQDLMVTQCESSENICNGEAFFVNSGRKDQNCQIIH